MTPIFQISTFQKISWRNQTLNKHVNVEHVRLCMFEASFVFALTPSFMKN